MKVERKFILNISKTAGFQPDVIEKAYRIALLLKEINNHPVLSDELVLKGGTAINFLYLPLPRLSVDLDFNFVGGITKEEMESKREKVANHLKDIFSFLKYQVEENNEYGLHQFFLAYTNSALNKDIVKLEINYLMRVSLLPHKEKKLKLPLFKDIETTVRTLSVEENYGGKIKALLSRGASRDLFDVYVLLTKGPEYKKALLRKIVIFFGCLDRSDFRGFTFHSIAEITDKEIKAGLVPLLRKGVVIGRSEMIKKVKPLLEDILKLRKNEKEYVKSFFKGEYVPELLFTKGEVADLSALKNHPVALWKQQHIKEWLKKQGKGKK